MKNIYKALADFQQECPVIHKDTKGFGYTYADLPQILGIINPLLKKHNLGFTQPMNGDKIKTIIFHTESGETMESETDIPQGVSLKGMNDFQVLGSAITYLRRYALSSILGIITDKDTDAHGEQVQKQQPQKQKDWLNIGSESWNKLVERVSRGENFTLDQIKKKYNVSSDTTKALEELNIF